MIGYDHDLDTGNRQEGENVPSITDTKTSCRTGIRTFSFAL